MNKRLIPAENKKNNQSISYFSTAYLGNGDIYSQNRPMDEQHHDSQERKKHGERESNSSFKQRGNSSSGLQSKNSDNEDSRGKFRTGLATGKAKIGLRRIAAEDCLNFHFESRRQHATHNVNRRRTTPLVVFNREEYLHANFSFDVSDAVNVDELLSTVDPQIDWEDVLEVETAVAEDYRCPISLEAPPLCPHITPCGHIFSFSSIIQHLLNVGGSSLFVPAPCPMCYAPFVAKSLRSVRFRYKEVPKIGNYWKFVLMQRDKKSCIPKPVVDECAWRQPTRKRLERFTVKKDVISYFESIATKLARAASKFTDEGDREEMVELRSYMVAVDNLSLRARNFETRRLERLMEQGKTKLTHEDINAQAKTAALAVKQSFHKTLQSMKSTSSNLILSTTLPLEIPMQTQSSEEFLINENVITLTKCDSTFEETPQGSNLEVHDDNHQVAELDDSYYFYQSEDGEPVFLHPANINCLLKHYGSFQNFPVYLSGQVTDVEEIIQSDIIRKRIRHLSHLPKHAVLQLVELDLSEQLPEECLGAVIARKAKKEQKAKEQDLIEESYDQREFYQQSFAVLPKQTLDMSSMPPLSSNSQPATEIEIQKQKEWKESTFSFASVAKNGYIPNNTLVVNKDTDGLSNMQSLQEAGEPTHGNRKKGSKKKKKKIILLANSGNRR